MASAAGMGGQGSSLRVGDVFSRSFAVWSRIVLPCCLIYGLQLLPSVLQTLAVRQHRIAVGAGFGLSIAVATILGGLFGIIGHGVVISAGNDVLQGRALNVSNAISVGMKRFFPMLGLAICFGLTAGLGFVLLIVPGIILYAMYFPCSPVCVLERLGPINSMKRSARLTKGARWKIFGILLLGIVLGAVALGLPYAVRLLAGDVASAVVQLIVSSLVGVFESLLGMVVYNDLVVEKEGFGGNRLAAVFD